MGGPRNASSTNTTTSTNTKIGFDRQLTDGLANQSKLSRSVTEQRTAETALSAVA